MSPSTLPHYARWCVTRNTTSAPDDARVFVQGVTMTHNVSFLPAIAEEDDFAFLDHVM